MNRPCRNIPCRNQSTWFSMPGVQVGCVRIDLLAPLGGILLRQQFLDRNLDLSRIRHVPARIREGQAHGLDLQVQPVRIQRILRQLKPLEQVEGDQGGNALTIGWALPKAQAFERGRDRLFPGSVYAG